MPDLINHLQQGSEKHQNKIINLISPLERIYGIDAHAYYRIDSEGFLTYLSNLPHIAEYYFANKLYDGNPFLKHPSLVESQYVLTTEVDNSSFQHGQVSVETKYQLNNQFLILEKEGDVLHAHGFATTHTNLNLTNLYLNNLERFRLYCRYFREETACLQKK